MKIQINNGITERETVVGGGNNQPSVTIATQLKKERVILDKNGNEISSLNPRNKQIIKRADQKENE